MLIRMYLGFRHGSKYILRRHAAYQHASAVSIYLGFRHADTYALRV
jgi:hypothetical protein